MNAAYLPRLTFRNLSCPFVKFSVRSTTISGSHKYRLQSTSTTVASKTNDGRALDFSVSGLGLEKSFVTPVLASIRQLPEIEQVFKEKDGSSEVLSSHNSVLLDDLKRAEQVFASFQKGGREHLAVCALVAEYQQRLALYEESIQTLNEMKHLLQSGGKEKNSMTLIGSAIMDDDITLAQAKVFWTKGDFAQSQELCESIVSTYNDLEESFSTTNLHMASAMSGKALSQLMAMNSLDDAYSVRDFFRITIKFLERHPPTSNSLPQAVAYSNCGSAEAIYALFLEETNNVSVPMDAALRSWFQGQTLLKTNGEEYSSSSNGSWASKTLQAYMQANLAWGILNYETDRSDRLSKASEYAKKALAVQDDGNVGGMRRVLAIVASCYHQAGSAVTAEGLYQSAIDRTNISSDPSSLLELQDAYLGYSGLCKQWEKRGGDAKRLEQESNAINDLLPDGWKNKQGMHGTLWFWTPGDFI